MFQEGIELGRKIKEVRLATKMSLSVLASKAGCSESSISKIENGKGNPSLNLLHRLANALDISIGHLFAHENGTCDFVLRQGERPIIGSLSPSQGVALEALMNEQSDQQIQAHIHIVEPGGKTEHDIVHEGEEVGYILEGGIDLTVNGETVHVSEGDSFFFKSSLPHRYANNGPKQARVLWVNTPPTF